MPKTPSNKLFNLINSLSGSEKRYFKLFVNKNQTGKDNKYILLFDAVDAQKAAGYKWKELPECRIVTEGLPAITVDSVKGKRVCYKLEK